MTGSDRTRIELLDFDQAAIDAWRDPRGRHHDWPVVYVINDDRRVYVGETTRAKGRLREHHANPQKRDLDVVRVVIDEEFNKSACLDLESRLIAWMHADGRFAPMNGNDGQSNSNYFERETRYQPIFDAVFAKLRDAGLFQRSAPEIENLNLFKLSPFKALNDEQLVAVEGILEGLIADLDAGLPSTAVVQGGPGTGKTIVAIFLLKLIRDIQRTVDDNDIDDDGRFADFFREGYRDALQGRRIGFVVPQQSLRKTIQTVFRRTPGLGQVQVLSPYTVAASPERWDLLIIDETHRLTHRGSGPTRAMFAQRSLALFGERAAEATAVDWIIEKSDHQVFLLDGDQSVRPADVAPEVLRMVRDRAQRERRHYSLESQMRVAAGDDYLTFASRLLTEAPVPARVSAGYDLRLFDDVGELRDAIAERESEAGLARMVAGYAWPWASKGRSGDDAPYDIELDGVRLRWNRTDTDWIASAGSEDEVGSVHTVQGYDLNYAGVIIGPDVVWDAEAGRVRPVKGQHFDSEVGRVRDEAALLEYIRNAYYVLLTRGMRGTYVYVCDPGLRERVRAAIGG